MTDYQLGRLSARSFEQLSQALLLQYFGPHITVFGDGPDGGREATFLGTVFYPNCQAGWSGKGVLQVKFRQVPDTRGGDANWLLDMLRVGQRERLLTFLENSGCITAASAVSNNNFNDSRTSGPPLAGSPRYRQRGSRRQVAGAVQCNMSKK